MGNGFQIKDRGIQILGLLKQYGPLSFWGLQSMIDPPMKDRRLYGSLAILVKHGLITKRLERCLRASGVFYQLNQDEEIQKQIASVLKCSANELRQPYFRNRELIHTEACALLVYKLSRIFPGARVLRDFEFYHNSFVQEILLTDRHDYEFQPDVLLTFQGNAGSPRVSVAFEIERSKKSERKLIAKLHKYANGTMLDGVVYICDSKQVSEPVRRAFKTKIEPKAWRINHYGEYFFLFSNEPDGLISEEKKMFSSGMTPISFVAWIAQLRGVPLEQRRNQLLKVVAERCYNLENRA